jgi:hypothetical protein
MEHLAEQIEQDIARITGMNKPGGGFPSLI